MSPSIYTIQIVGESDKLDGFLQSLGAVHLLEVVRTGVSGIARGEKVLSI
jgi:acetolactate synthase-1/3 small subunit